MVLSDEHKFLIKKLYQLKEYNARQLNTQFSDKGWTTSSINRLLKKCRAETWAQCSDVRAATDREVPNENIDQVNDMALSQEDQPALTAQSVKYHGRQAFLSHLLSASYERICS